LRQLSLVVQLQLLCLLLQELPLFRLFLSAGAGAGAVFLSFPIVFSYETLKNLMRSSNFPGKYF